MMKWEIVFYQTGRGDRPVQSFIDKQDRDTRAKIERYFNLLIMNGPNLGMPYTKYLGSGLYELRIRANNEIRIFYIYSAKSQVIALVHAFRKRTQKTPLQEMRLARKRQKELTDL